MKQTLRTKIVAIITSFLAFTAVISVCVAATMLVNKQYFDTIFVSGGSMNPTLMGGHDDSAHAPYITGTGEYVKGDRVNFGKVDPSDKAKKNIKRYDIVTTYFPDDYTSSGELIEDADYKIKRVIALPGETFKIVEGILYVKENDEFVEIERKHLIDDSGKANVKDVSETTLKDGEYWVMGDHRSGSRDCVNFGKPVTFKNITGVLVVIEGTAEYFVHYNCKNCKKEVNEKDYLSGEVRICPHCGGRIGRGKGDIRDREYTYPKIV